MRSPTTPAAPASLIPYLRKAPADLEGVELESLCELVHEEAGFQRNDRGRVATWPNDHDVAICDD